MAMDKGGPRLDRLTSYLSSLQMSALDNWKGIIRFQDRTERYSGGAPRFPLAHIQAPPAIGHGTDSSYAKRSFACSKLERQLRWHAGCTI